MSQAGERRFSNDHEWAQPEGGRYRVGISDYAQDAVGDIVFVDLPAVGAAVTAGESVAEVESTKTVSSVLAPLSGTVVEINDQLGAAPEQINQDPYGTGWMFVIETDDEAVFSALMDEAAYLVHVKETS